jgi:hypothetical protein
MRTNVHFITEEDGRSLSVVNGVVTPSSQPKHLQNPPAGAKDVVISWERINNRYGIQRTFTTPLQYVLDAARIIRHYAYNVNYEHKLFHVIQRLKTYTDDTTFRQRYEYLYKGEIDLSTMKDEEDFVSCSIMEGGLDKLLKAKESTVFEIPFDDDAILVKMDGLPLQESHTWLSQTGLSVGNNLLGLSFINKEGAAFGVATFTVFKEDEPGDLSTSDKYFLVTAQAIDDIELKGSLSWTSLSNATSVELRLKSSLGKNLLVASALVSSGRIDDFTFQFDSEENEKWFLIILPVGGLDTMVLNESTFTIKYESRYQETFVKAFKPYDLFRKLVEKITGNADDAVSTLLQEESNLVLTSGDAVRGLEGAVIKTSLAQFYDHCNPVHFAGEGIINSKIEIAPREKYYNASDPIHLGSVKNFKRSFATDLQGNKLKMGWQPPDVEDVNGKFAFNGSLNLQSEITRVVRDLTMLSPYSSDPYEIEITRINLDGKTTTDDSADNKVFCLNVTPLPSQYSDSFVAFQDLGGQYTIGAVSSSIPVQPGTKFITSDTTNPGPFTVVSLLPLLGQIIIVVEEPVTNVAGAPVTLTIVSGLPHELTRKNYDTIEGVPTSDVFNIEELTPKRLALKNGPWLRSVFHPFDNTNLEFTSTDRNKDLLTTLDGLTIAEKAAIAISSLGGKLFKPLYFEFETEVPQDLIDLLEANPNRCFSFDWNGETYKGFNVKVSIAINTEESQSLKLLCAPDVDLSKFVM